MAPKRQIVGGLASVLLHGALLGWAVTRAPAREQTEAAPVEVERIELTSIAEGPLALRDAAGSPSEVVSSPEPARGEAASTVPEPEPAPDETEVPEPEPAARQPSPPKPPPVMPPPPEAPTTPTADATASATTSIPPAAHDEPRAEPPASPTASDHPGQARAAGTSDGRGVTGSSIGLAGSDGSPDHSAYGAELVRLVKAEIDTDPVPGLRPHDWIEVELEVLPSGRLARRGLGKYDYAQVIRSSLGPVRMRAILRRILRASQGFPPHPSSFPRQRYVVGFTVRFRELRG